MDGTFVGADMSEVVPQDRANGNSESVTQAPLEKEEHTISVSEYYTFWQFNLNCKNVLYLGIDGVLLKGHLIFCNFYYSFSM